MVVGLYSRQTAVKIIDYVANEIKKDIFTKIIELNRKVCVIIDEASSISNKCSYNIFEDYDHLPTIFYIIFVHLACRKLSEALYFGQSPSDYHALFS